MNVGSEANVCLARFLNVYWMFCHDFDDDWVIEYADKA